MSKIIMDGMSVAPVTFFLLAEEIDELLAPFEGPTVYNDPVGTSNVDSSDATLDNGQAAIEIAIADDEAVNRVFKAPATATENDAAVVE